LSVNTPHQEQVQVFEIKQKKKKKRLKKKRLKKKRLKKKMMIKARDDTTMRFTDTLRHPYS
jgi:hypothetical protein